MLAKDWSIKLVKAVGDGLPGGESTLRNKLLPIVSPYTIVGRIATYFIERYGFSPDCRIIAGSGDNPQSKVLVTGNLIKPRFEPGQYGFNRRQTPRYERRIQRHV